MTATYTGRRQGLQKLEGERAVFTGIFRKYGSLRSWTGPNPRKTFLLEDLRDDNGDIVADHVWISSFKMLELLGLHDGDIIQFSAGIRRYHKDAPEEHAATDFAPTRLSNVRVVARARGAMSA